MRSLGRCILAVVVLIACRAQDLTLPSYTDRTARSVQLREVYEWYTSYGNPRAQLVRLPVRLPRLPNYATMAEFDAELRKLRLEGDPIVESLQKWRALEGSRLARRRSASQAGASSSASDFCGNQKVLYVAPRGTSAVDQSGTPAPVAIVDRTQNSPKNLSRIKADIEQRSLELASPETVLEQLVAASDERYPESRLSESLKAHLADYFEFIKSAVPHDKRERIRTFQIEFGYGPPIAGREGLITATVDKEVVYVTPLLVSTLMRLYPIYGRLNTSFDMLCKGRSEFEDSVLRLRPFLRQMLTFVVVHELAHVYLETTDELECDLEAATRAKAIDGHIALKPMLEILLAIKQLPESSVWPSDFTAGNLSDVEKRIIQLQRLLPAEKSK